jgi:Ca2+-binding EF-hand superfamily protein
MLEYIHGMKGLAPSSLQVLVQLPEDIEFNSFEKWYTQKAYFNSRCKVFRDNDSQNAKAVKQNLGDWLRLDIASDYGMLANINSVFKTYDKDGNGKITRDEWRDVLTQLGVSLEVSIALFDTADTDKDDAVDLMEFILWLFTTPTDESQMMAELTRTETDRESYELLSYIRDIKGIFNCDGELRLDLAEFLKICNRAEISEQDGRALFKEIDEDHDGVVDAKEVVNSAVRFRRNSHIGNGVTNAIAGST